MQRGFVISVVQGPVKVEIKGRDDQGRFTEAAEIVLNGGECAMFTLLGDESIQIFAADEEKG